MCLQPMCCTTRMAGRVQSRSSRVGQVGATMTKEQFDTLVELIFRVQRIAYHASTSCLPYDLAVAIHRAGELQFDCTQFIETLRPADTSSGSPDGK